MMRIIVSFESCPQCLSRQVYEYYGTFSRSFLTLLGRARFEGQTFVQACLAAV